MDHGHLPLAGSLIAAWGLPAALFLAGLVGGATHCVGMCGPFVLAQVSAGLDRTGVRAYGTLERARGAALLPYHLGRTTTYVGLGALAGVLAGTLSGLPALGWVPGALLAVAAALFLLQALERAVPLLRRGHGAGPSGGGLGAALSRLARPLFGDPTGPRGYLLGVVLGFLPCGMLWAALAAAGGSGGAVPGAVAMLAFALGTVPALVGVGFAGQLFGRRLGPAMAWVAPALFLLNAGVLGVFAWRAIA